MLVTIASATAASACASGARAGGAAPGADLLLSTRYGVEAEVSLPELTRHPRGFLYRDIEQGNGPRGAVGRWVQVSYVVRLADGREVDRAEREDPVRLRLGERGIIRALDASLREMRVGGVRQLVIPPHLAYGARGNGPVPGNAVLVMVVRLERVE